MVHAEGQEAALPRAAADQRVVPGGLQAGRAQADQVALAQPQAEADRKRTEILSIAARDSLKIRGEGDGKAAAIYSAAYGRNPEFYAFYRSIQAYKNSLGKEGDVMVVSPDSDFFKYMRSPGGSTR